jgi:hypothetical protein
MAGQDGTVTIERAAELMNVDVRSLRQWSAIGSLEIERRGDAEFVHMGTVQALLRSGIAPGRVDARRGALRGLLREAKSVDAHSVAGLQELARERATTP